MFSPLPKGGSRGVAGVEDRMFSPLPKGGSRGVAGVADRMFSPLPKGGSRGVAVSESLNLIVYHPNNTLDILCDFRICKSQYGESL